MEDNTYTHLTFKPIPGYEGLYEIASNGVIRSLAHTIPCGRGAGLRVTEERILRPFKTNKGQLKIQLFKAGKRRILSVTALINKTFKKD